MRVFQLPTLIGTLSLTAHDERRLSVYLRRRFQLEGQSCTQLHCGLHRRNDKWCLHDVDLRGDNYYPIPAGLAREAAKDIVREAIEAWSADNYDDVVLGFRKQREMELVALIDSQESALREHRRELDEVRRDIARREEANAPLGDGALSELVGQALNA